LAPTCSSQSLNVYFTANGGGSSYVSNYSFGGGQQTETIRQMTSEIYGSSRIGTYQRDVITRTATFTGTVAAKTNVNIQTSTLSNAQVYSRILGHARYELTNHLGNVLSVVSDRKISNTTNTQYIADVMSTTDYYPFGMPSRSFSSEAYRYGFNVKYGVN
jgi:hypothetical protein